MFILLIVWLKGCAMRSPSGSVRSWWAEEAPQPCLLWGAQCECLSCHCCSGLPTWCCWSWTKCNSFAITRQWLPHFWLFGFSEAHLCCKLTAGEEGSKGGLCLRRGVWSLPCALGRSSAPGFVLDTCIKLELIGQGEVRSTVCVSGFTGAGSWPTDSCYHRC